MGGDGHGHGAPYTVPDYRIYKVSDVPKLVVIEKALAARGLKDPWLRNEVWRYNEKEFGTVAGRVRYSFQAGAKLGIGMFLLTIVGTKIYDRIYPDEHCNGHD